MSIQKFKELFSHRNVQCKFTAVSPLAGLSFGETLLFATNPDPVLVQTFGYLSTGSSELVLVFTSKALNLIREPEQETYLFNCLCTTNRKLKLGYWIFTQLTVSHHLQYRAILKGNEGFSEEMMMNILGDMNREYLGSGKELRNLLNSPFRNLEPEIEHPKTQLIRSILAELKAVRLGTSDIYTMSFPITQRQLTQTQDRLVTNMKGQVHVHKQFLTIFFTIADEEDKKSTQKRLARLNSAESIKLGSVVLQRSERVLSYKAEYVYVFENEATIRSTLLRLIPCIAKKAKHREPLRFSTRSIASIIKEVQNNSQYSSQQTNTLFPYQKIVRITPDNRDVVAFWTARPGQYITEEKKGKSFVKQGLWPIFKYENPWALHLHCIVLELMNVWGTLETLHMDLKREEFLKAYIEPVFPERRESLPEDSFVHLLRASKVVMESLEKPPGELVPQYYLMKLEDETVKVTKKLLAQSSTHIWDLCKKTVTRILINVLPPDVFLKQYGFKYTSEGIYTIEETLPDLHQVSLSVAVPESTRKVKMEILSNVGDTLAWLHERKLAHLQLCPTAVKLTNAHFPRLANIAFSAVMLDPPSENTNLADLYFFAPEVLRLMQKKQHWLDHSEDKVENHFTCISGAADVYSFGILMHWLLVLNQPAQYPTYLPAAQSQQDHLVQIQQMKRRPFIPEEFERNEPELADLMQQCWAPWRKRPSMKSLLTALGRFK